MKCVSQLGAVGLLFEIGHCSTVLLVSVGFVCSAFQRTKVAFHALPLIDDKLCQVVSAVSTKDHPTPLQQISTLLTLKA